MHCDISDGNVLLLSDGGFLLDFDYSAFTDDGLKCLEKLHPEVKTVEIKTASKGVTVRLQVFVRASLLTCIQGTLPFMSLASLRQVEMTNSAMPFCHSCADDFEGFYFLLVWLILRHTDHAHPEGAQACADLFDGGVSEVKTKKGAWFFDYLYNAPTGLPHLKIRENAPLTNLVTSLTGMLVEHHQCRLSPPITHVSFLAAFDEALASPGWPENDKSREFERPHIQDALYPSVNSDGDVSMPQSRGTSSHIYPRQHFVTAQGPAASGSQGSVGSSGKRKREEEEGEEEEEQGRVRRSARGAAQPATKSSRGSARRQRTKAK